MGAKKSKALAAAERLAASDEQAQKRVAAAQQADDGKWTRGMVERAILVFNDIERVPPYDEDGVRKLVVDFLCFVDRVELGGISDDALPMARAFVERGYQWLADHPRYAPFVTQPWTAEMVEQTILWFTEVSGRKLDRKEMNEVGRRLRTFSDVVGTGAVEAGEAETLAQAFLDHAKSWIDKNPDVRAAFTQQS